MKIKDLKAGTRYTFYLYAGNAVGFGKAAKFKVEIPMQNVPRVRVGITGVPHKLSILNDKYII